MRRVRLFGFVALTVLGIARTSPTESLYTWAQVVTRGIPDFTNQVVARQALASAPVHLSFPSGEHAVFVFVRYEEETYAVYHDRETFDVVGIARVGWDSARSQGLRLYDFYVDTGLLKGMPFSGQFLYVAEDDRILVAVCRIAALSREARAHPYCPRNA